MLSACLFDASGGVSTGGAGGAADGGQGLGGKGEGASGAGASTGGEGEGGSPAGEICTNGTDDDNDGETDCEDSDCGAYECVPPHPGAIAYVAPLGSGSCGAGLEERDLLSCTGCDCTATDGTCAAEFTVYDESDCTDTGVPVNDGPACYDIADGYYAFRARPVVSEAATCAPIQPTVTGTSTAHCSYDALSAGTCEAERVCIPKMPDASPRCVLVDAATSCGGAYNVDNGVSDTGDGDATCSCSCSVDTTTCDAPLHADSERSNCSGSGDVNLPLDDQCFYAGDTESIESTAGTLTAECTASSTKQRPTPQVRLCCMP